MRTRPTIPGWAVPLTFLLGVLWLFALCTIIAFAADDPQTQINALQGAIGECRQQQADVSNGAQARAADYMVEIGRLRKRVAELEEAAKTKK